MSADELVKLEALAESFITQLLTTLGVPVVPDVLKSLGAILRDYIQSHYTAGPTMSVADLHTAVAAAGAPVGMGPVVTMLIVKAAEYLLQLWLSRHHS